MVSKISCLEETASDGLKGKEAIIQETIQENFPVCFNNFVEANYAHLKSYKLMIELKNVLCHMAAYPILESLDEGSMSRWRRFFNLQASKNRLSASHDTQQGFKYGRK